VAATETTAVKSLKKTRGPQQKLLELKVQRLKKSCVPHRKILKLKVQKAKGPSRNYSYKLKSHVVLTGNY